MCGSTMVNPFSFFILRGKKLLLFKKKKKKEKEQE